MMLAAPLQECDEPDPGGQPPTTCDPAEVAATQDDGIGVVDSEVINGRDSLAGCRTYQVMLVADNGVQQIFFCGGTLIADSWVLTAAHCLEGFPPDLQLAVYVGGVNSDGSDMTEIPVAGFKIHPQYATFGNSYDIALLELDGVADPSLVRAYLPSPAIDQVATAVGQELVISGWGAVSVDPVTAARSFGPVLQEIELPVQDASLCSNLGVAMTEREICTAQLDPLASGCNGDSGGPLATTYEGDFYVFGVVSYGDFFCNFRTVFTRVSEFTDWIDAETGGGQVVIG
jgi:secreted trypsin-like serine protease